MPRRSCKDCCRIWITRTPSRSPIGSGRSGCRCNGSWAFPTGIDEPLRDELVRQVGQQLGEDDGVIVFDPSAFPKVGKGVGRRGQAVVRTVGQGRQLPGGGLHGLRFASGTCPGGHATVPSERVDPGRSARREKAGVPKDFRYRTRHQLCLEMLAKHGETAAACSGSPAMTNWAVPTGFAGVWTALEERYLLAVPSNTLIRDLEATRRLTAVAAASPSVPGRAWTGGRRCADEANWTEIDVRDGAKGPLVVEVLKRRVVARTDNRQEGHKEVLVVIRYRDRDNRSVVKTDYYLSNAPAETELAEFARVAKAEHRIEECLQRAKSEAGLADYEVRNWKGWHHHQTLSLIATWFLVTEARRGKKMDARDHRSTNPRRHLVILHRVSGCDTTSRIQHERQQRLKRNELARLYHWKQHNRLPPLNINKRQI